MGSGLQKKSCFDDRVAQVVLTHSEWGWAELWSIPGGIGLINPQSCLYHVGGGAEIPVVDLARGTVWL